jgi:hypothetical protein
MFGSRLKYFGVLILLTCLGIFPHGLMAQKFKSPNYRKFDDKFFHFGFALGMNRASVLPLSSDTPHADTNLLRTSIEHNPGLNLGFIGSIKLGHPTLTLRFCPSLSFQSKEVVYLFATEPVTLKSAIVESTLLDFPLLLKYKTFRYNNFASYFIGGMQYSVDLQSKEKVPQNVLDPFLKLKRHDFQAQIGAGVDFYLPYFKFGLEVKMSHGIVNSMVQDQTILSRPFDKLYNRVVWFCMTFEG